MRKMLTVLAILMIATWALAAWPTPGMFAPDAGLPTGGHGVEVDGAGKIWYASFYARDSIEVNGVYQPMSAIYVYNTDGTPASFSPIRTITVDGVTDTLGGQTRGMNVDNNGDIVITTQNRNVSYDLYRINHLTGEGMAKLTNPTAGSTTAPGFDADGNMVLFNVVGTDQPIRQYDYDFAEIGAAATATGICRTIEFSADGKDIYFFPFTAQYMVRFHSDDGVGSDYDVIDTLITNMSIESVAWNPVTGNLWISNDARGTGYTSCMHYAYDVVSETFVDSIDFDEAKTLGEVARGIAFSADGLTAYLTFFNDFLPGAIYVTTKDPAGVWQHTGTFIDGYALKANYPNPFNPSTQLDVVMGADGVADLRIYDVRGAEVAVLNNSHLSAGSHTFTFDAANFAAGVYVAKFTANGAMYTQTMTLVK